MKFGFLIKKNVSSSKYFKKEKNSQNVFKQMIFYFNAYTQKTVSLNQRNIYLIFGQRKNFFQLKKVLLIQRNFL